MLTSIRGLTAATLFAGTAAIAAPAMAAEEAAAETTLDTAIVNVDLTNVVAPAAATLDTGAIELTRASMPVIEETANKMEGESGFELSGNVALVTDYRFRGVSFSDGDFALQGGIDLAHSSGFYIGTWASSISGGGPYGELELDVYGGWSGDISDGVSFDIGLLYYIYPTENELANFLGVDTDYFEPYASIGFAFGPVSTSVGVAYAWDQSSLGDQDNLYIYTDFEYGIPDTPLTLTAHLGWTDGVFATDFDSFGNQSSSFDWGLGASWAVTDSLSLGFNYVDTEGPSFEDATDAGFFFTLGYSM